MAALTSALTVTTSVEGKTTFYHVHPSDDTSVVVKTTRYSELTALHGLFMEVAPEFAGRLPAKTLTRCTDSEFVEQRRQDIEKYLRQAAADPLLSQSQVFKRFLPVDSAKLGERASAENTESKPSKETVATESTEQAPVMQPQPSQQEQLEQRKHRLSSQQVLSPVIGEELTKKLSMKQTALQEAETKQQALKSNLETSEQAQAQAKTEAEMKARAENEAAAALTKHHDGLDKLMANLLAKKAQSSEKEAQQVTVVNRLSKELESAGASTKAARTKYEEARRACAEAIAKSRTNMDRAVASEATAEASLASAKEVHAAMSAAMTQLKSRVASANAEVAVAERERESASAALEALEAESNEAEVMRARAESGVRASAGDVAAHAEDAARRSRAYEAEVRRANERCNAAAALRDLSTRKLLKGDDRVALDGLEAVSRAAADNASAASERAAKRFAADKEADAEKAKHLQEVAETATRDFNNRQQIADALKKRVDSSRVLLHNSKAKLAGATAAAQAAREGFKKVEDQVNGPLAKAVEDATAKLDEARAHVAAMPKAAEKELAGLKHAEEAEGLVLKQLEEGESKLIDMLNAARIVADEARDDAKAEEQNEEPAPELDLLVRSGKASLADKQRSASEAETAYSTAASAVAAAERELKELVALRDQEDARSEHSDEDAKSDASDDDAKSDSTEMAERRAEKAQRAAELQQLVERIASTEARVADLQLVATERKVASDAANTVVKTAREELAALEEQQQARSSTTSVVKLVSAEIEAVDDCIRKHQDLEREAVAKVRALSADWGTAKEALNADLHRAYLKVSTCKAEVTATVSLCDSLMATP